MNIFQIHKFINLYLSRIFSCWGQEPNKSFLLFLLSLLDFILPFQVCLYSQNDLPSLLRDLGFFFSRMVTFFFFRVSFISSSTFWDKSWFKEKLQIWVISISKFLILTVYFQTCHGRWALSQIFLHLFLRPLHLPCLPLHWFGLIPVERWEWIRKIKVWWGWPRRWW